MALRLVVGLGNPGPRYARTRHNVGFRLVESIAGSGPWRNFRGLGRVCARENGTWLAEPLTFMNESGRFVGALAGFHKLTPAEILVCFDDVALPLGRLRLRARGSSGGQKGMQSIIDAIGTQEIARLRVGIGPKPALKDAADFVLEPFTTQQEASLAEALGLARDAVETAVQEGLPAAMTRFNASERPA